MTLEKLAQGMKKNYRKFAFASLIFLPGVCNDCAKIPVDKLGSAYQPKDIEVVQNYQEMPFEGYRI